MSGLCCSWLVVTGLAESPVVTAVILVESHVVPADHALVVLQ